MTNTTAYDRIREALEQHGQRITNQTHHRLQAQCPAHPDKDPSLSVTNADGMTLIHCHAGCNTDDILTELNLTKKDLYDDPRGRTYEYVTIDGIIGRRVHRTPDKKFRQSGDTKTTPALYHLPELVQAVTAEETVYLVEGEKDADNLTKLTGATATTAPQGATNLRKADLTPLYDAHVVAIVDKDEPGAEWARTVEHELADKAASLEFKQAATGKDASDHLAAGYRLNDFTTYRIPGPLDGNINARDLLDMEFPDIEYTVPGIIPEGLTMLAAAPKIGKSWMVLGIAIAASTGGKALGTIQVDQRPVLYLALEDGPRRLQSRMNRINAAPGPEFDLRTTLGEHRAGDVMAAYLAKHGHKKPLIILDTFGKARKVYEGSDSYQHDYAEASALKTIVDSYPGSSLVVVHHTNKGNHNDFMNAVSGTNGIAGAADTIIVIKRERHNQTATLNVSSRDALEGEYSITMDNGAWHLDGETLHEAHEAVENRKATEGVGDTMQDVLEKVQQYPEGIRAQDIAETLHLKRRTVDTYLDRAYQAGRVAKPKRGIYTPVRSVRSVRNEGSDDTEPTNLTLLTLPTPPQDEPA